jgi:hypothetical protein
MSESAANTIRTTLIILLVAVAVYVYGTDFADANVVNTSDPNLAQFLHPKPKECGPAYVTWLVCE